MKNAFPRAREGSLIIKTLPDEVLVYDLKTDKAHCLNRTAAFVWNNCNGRKSVSEITRLLAKELRAPVEESVTWLALDQLEEFKLLQERVTKPANVNGISRRQMVRRLGLAAAVGLPIITSIIAPTPAQAASCGGPCTSAAQCTVDNCNNCTGPTGNKHCTAS